MSREADLVAQNVALIGQNGRLQLEVERLTAERESMRESCMGLVQQNYRQYDEVMRLTADRDDAYLRGAEAMRVALLQRASWGSDFAERIRNEAVPEDRE